MFEEKNTLYWVIIAFHLITIYIFGSVIRGKKKKKKANQNCLQIPEL